MKRTSLFVAALLAAMPLFAGHALASGDPAKGKRVFNKCRACHNADKEVNKMGPYLVGLFGRHAGSVEGYNYSDAMKNADVVWNEDTLKEYLKDPKAYIPHNKMPFAGLKKESDVENVIAYLEEVTKKPE